MADGEAYYLIAGMALAGLLAAFSAWVAGWWQNKTMVTQAELNRKLEIEKLNHESKIKKLQHKIATLYLQQSRILEIQRLKRYTEQIQIKILGNSFTIGDQSLFLMRLKNYQLLSSEFIDDENRYFSELKPENKLKLVRDYFMICFSEYNDTYHKLSDKLDASGWSLIVKNRNTVIQIKRLVNYLDKKLISSMTEKEEKKFIHYFEKQHDEIQEALRVEIHLETEK